MPTKKRTIPNKKRLTTIKLIHPGIVIPHNIFLNKINSPPKKLISEIKRPKMLIILRGNVEK